MSAGLSFDLSIDPDVRFVSTVRRFVEASLERLQPDADTVFRVAMTAQELLENAGKYCAAGPVQLHFSARVEGGETIIDLSLANTATAGNITRLSDRVAAILGAVDPFAHYQRLLRCPAEARASGLGLARIAAEAEMHLGLEVTGSTVAIVATTRAHLPARD
jgi:hypothetical protein